MKQFVIDANKCVLNKPSPEAKVEDGDFEENEVYAIDIAVSTGDGKTRVRLPPPTPPPPPPPPPPAPSPRVATACRSPSKGQDLWECVLAACGELVATFGDLALHQPSSSVGASRPCACFLWLLLHGSWSGTR